MCGDSWKRNLADTIFFAGRLVGALLFGELSDRYPFYWLRFSNFSNFFKRFLFLLVSTTFCFRLGRKPVLIVTSLCQVLVGCGAAFVGDLSVFLTLYFIQGCLQCGIYILSFVLGTSRYFHSSIFQNQISVFRRVTSFLHYLLQVRKLLVQANANLPPLSTSTSTALGNWCSLVWHTICGNGVLSSWQLVYQLYFS